VQRKLIVTIDGPAGTGKTSVAHRLAERLGTECLDSGSMYRAVALLSLQRGIEPDDGPGLARTTKEIGIHFDWDQSPPRLLLGGGDVGDRIRDMDVSAIVSIVAKQPEVRQVLVVQQQQIARDHPCLVTEGRDQGSVVFPDATVHFFLEADDAERTRRRVSQLAEFGKAADPVEVQEDIARRDHIDSTRSIGPLVCPEDAVVIDTSDRTIDEVVTLMEMEVLSRTGGT